MIRIITIVALGFVLNLSDAFARTVFPEDHVAYFDMGNTGYFSSYPLLIDPKEGASCHYLLADGEKVNGENDYWSEISELDKIDIIAMHVDQKYAFVGADNLRTDDQFDPINDAQIVLVFEENENSNSNNSVIAADIGGLDENIQIVEVSVYPNPASDFLVIESNEFEIEKLEMVDVIGQVILYVEPNNSRIELNISKLPIGVYFVDIMVGNQWINKKVRIVR